MPSSDYPEQSIPDIIMYWGPADWRDVQLRPDKLSKLLDPTKQYLQQVKVAKLGQVVPTPLATILSNLSQISTYTEFKLTLETFSYDLSTFPSTSTQPNSTYNNSKSRNWDKSVLPPLETILSDLFQISTCTVYMCMFQLTDKTSSFELSTFPRTSTESDSNYNRSNSRNWDEKVVPL